MTPCPAPLGAEITGLDVRGVLDRDNTYPVWQNILAAFAERKVLFFRDQELTASDLVSFAAHFGPIGHYPFAEPLPDNPDVIAVIKEPDQTSNFGGMWHTDTPYLERPAAATALYAVEVPDEGGDTIWSDMVAALDALPRALVSELSALRAVQSAAKNKQALRADPLHDGTMSGVHEEDMDTRQATHPVVRTHPVTGEKTLFVSPAHTTNFAGLTEEASKPLLDELFAHAIQDQFCHRHHWTPGTLAIWDNRVSLHYPLNDYHGHRREMLRVTIDGEVPV
ncbi:MAG: TauD/TfdA dioxygenase family protein [Alphaproteobacteria bacterium]